MEDIDIMSEVSPEPAGELVETVARAIKHRRLERQSPGLGYASVRWAPSEDDYHAARAAIAAMPAAGEVEQLNGALSAYKAICERRNQQNETLRAQLAASQADVARLREALRACRRAVGGGADEPRRNVREIVDLALEPKP